MRIHLGAGALLLTAGVLSSACGSQAEAVEDVALLPVSQLPPEVQRAAAPVREAYQFAAVNGAILRQVPCYCGCGGMGHTSVHSCYVNGGGAGQCQ